MKTESIEPAAHHEDQHGAEFPSLLDI